MAGRAIAAVGFSEAQGASGACQKVSACSGCVQSLRIFSSIIGEKRILGHFTEVFTAAWTASARWENRCVGGQGTVWDGSGACQSAVGRKWRPEHGPGSNRGRFPNLESAVQEGGARRSGAQNRGPKGWVGQ